MNAPPETQRAAPGRKAARDDGTTSTDHDSAAVVTAQGADLLTRSLLNYNVVIIGGDKCGLWGRFGNRESAERMASKLRRHGFDARIEVAP